MSVFKELLAVKAFRENKAEMGVAKERVALVEAERQREAATAALERYRVEANEQEQAWYQDLCSRVVQLRAIENVQQDVVMLRAGEREHETREQQAHKAVAEQQDKLRSARQVLRDANRMKQKFVELATAQADEAAFELERKEDLEMEEAASVRRERDEWEAGDD
jgi:type III secretion protein O